MTVGERLIFSAIYTSSLYWAIQILHTALRQGEAHAPEGPVVVVGEALHERDLRGGRGADGPVEAMPHAPVHVAREELLERVVQRRVALQPMMHPFLVLAQ